MLDAFRSLPEVVMRTPMIVLVLLAALTGPTSGAFAAWQPDGTRLSPLPTASPFESYGFEQAVSDNAGGAFALWLHTRYTLGDETFYDISAQRVDILGNLPAPWIATGTQLRSWFQPNGTGTSSVATRPLLEDGTGGAILPYLDYTFLVEPQNLLRLHHILPNATNLAMPISNTTFGGYPAYDAACDADGGGGVVMIVQGQTFAQPLNPLPPSPLYVQRVDGSGLAQWPSGGAPGPELIAAGLGANRGLAALNAGAGGGFFAWIDNREPGDPDLYVQRIDATGAVAAGWPAGGVQVCGATGDQYSPHLVTDGADGVFVTWVDVRDGVSSIYSHHVLSNGALAGGIPVDGKPLLQNAVGDALVDTRADGLGGLFIVRAPGVSILHRLNGALNTAPGWPANGIQLDASPPGDGRVGMQPDGLGGIYVSFRNGFGNVAPQGLYAQHFAGDGSFAPGWTSDGYRLSGNGQKSQLVRSGSGAIAVWADTRFAEAGVYAQRIVTDGPVPAQLALVNASASADRVTLRWYSGGAPNLAATVERADDSGTWSTLAAVTGDATGYIRYEDRAVETGQRYGYRLAWFDGTTSRTSEATWLTVPSGLALAIESPRPNPASGAVSFAFSLPREGGARLEVIDLSGRRVISRDLALGAGRHLVRCEEAAALAPGVYTVRLAQGADSRLSRLCVVR
jgi:hypothetical protein